MLRIGSIRARTLSSKNDVVEPAGARFQNDRSSGHGQGSGGLQILTARLSQFTYRSAIATDSLNKPGVAVKDRGHILNSDRGARENRGCSGRHGSGTVGSDAIINKAIDHCMDDSEEWLTVGRVVGAQGLKGDLRINPSSDFPERFTRPGPRWLQAGTGRPHQEVALIRGRQLPGKSLFVVHFEGVETAAEAPRAETDGAR